MQFNLILEFNFHQMAVIDMEKLVTSTVMPANTTEEIPWVETTIAGGFRIWQVLFLSGAVLLAVGTLHLKFEERFDKIFVSLGLSLLQ